MKLYTDESSESELAQMDRMRAVAKENGWVARVIQGCILVIAKQHEGVSPQGMMDVFIKQMAGSCTGGNLQIGIDQLLRYQPGDLFVTSNGLLPPDLLQLNTLYDCNASSNSVQPTAV